MEAGGDANIVLVDSLSVESAEEEDDSNKTRIFILGDSTVKYYGDDNTIGGWGEYLVNYFNADSVKFINKAEGGRSTRSFINQGRLAEAMSEVRKGDYVFIQFGTNDQRTDTNAFMEHSVALGTPDANGIYPTVPGVKSKTPDSIYNFYKDTDYPYAETFYSYKNFYNKSLKSLIFETELITSKVYYSCKTGWWYSGSFNSSLQNIL